MLISCDQGYFPTKETLSNLHRRYSPVSQGLDEYMWDLFRKRRMRTRMHDRTWLAGEPVEEESTQKDRTPREECEVLLIGTSRAGEQRGSESDGVRKRHYRSHVDAVDNIGQVKARWKITCLTGFFSSFSFSSSAVPPVGPSGASELPSMIKRLICEAKPWPSRSPHDPVRYSTRT